MMAMPISLIDYSLNKSFISNNLCENRLKPELHCAGKCYLKKQLAKTNDNQSSRDQKGNSINIVIDFFESPDNSSFGCSDMMTVYSGQFQTQPIPSRVMGNIFHPPIV
jgi:hypothetical protein